MNLRSANRSRRGPVNPVIAAEAVPSGSGRGNGIRGGAARGRQPRAPRAEIQHPHVPNPQQLNPVDLVPAHGQPNIMPLVPHPAPVLGLPLQPAAPLLVGLAMDQAPPLHVAQLPLVPAPLPVQLPILNYQPARDLPQQGLPQGLPFGPVYALSQEHQAQRLQQPGGAFVAPHGLNQFAHYPTPIQMQPGLQSTPHDRNLSLPPPPHVPVQAPGAFASFMLRGQHEVNPMLSVGSLRDWSRAANIVVEGGDGLTASSFLRPALKIAESMIGLCFILIDEQSVPGSRVLLFWQIDKCSIALESFEACRLLEAGQEDYPLRVMFPFSHLGHLVVPGRQTLATTVQTIGTIGFPVPHRVLTVSFVNASSGPDFQRVEFSLISWDGSLIARLQDDINVGSNGIGAPVGSSTASTQKGVPPGMRHWLVCSEHILFGRGVDRELVYNRMLFGGPNDSNGGTHVSMTMSRPMNMLPKEADLFLEMGLVSTLSFDSVSKERLTEIRRSSTKTDSLGVDLGMDAMLGYKRLCNMLLLWKRVFGIKEIYSVVLSNFASAVRGLIETENPMFPNIASNGALNIYVDQVVLAFYAQLHHSNVSPADYDSLLETLKLDTSSDLFVHLQRAAELDSILSQVSQSSKRPRSPSPDPNVPGRGANKGKKYQRVVTTQYCFSFFSTAGCIAPQCRFAHTRPSGAADKAKITDGLLGRGLTLRPGSL